jgi:MoxR-like ATPase
VLLIDEIDRSDHEFEAFLLEFLSDFTVSIPERGTMRASRAAGCRLTSNRTRELHEALRRRCVYHWIDYPDPRRLRRDRDDARVDGGARTPRAGSWRRSAALRAQPLAKPPGVAETVEWAEAATLLQPARGRPGRAPSPRAIGVRLKDQDDLAYVAPHARRDAGGGGAA